MQRYNIYKLDIVVSNQLISRWIKLPWGQVREVEAAEETGQRVFSNLEVWFGQNLKLFHVNKLEGSCPSFIIP